MENATEIHWKMPLKIRKATCDLLIPEEHAYVSGEHCRLRVGNEGGLTLEVSSIYQYIYLSILINLAIYLSTYLSLYINIIRVYIYIYRHIFYVL